MTANYDREQRRALAEAVREGKDLRCPVCGGSVRRHPIPPRAEVSYVRRRAWLICSGCRRSAAVDIRPDGQP